MTRVARLAAYVFLALMSAFGLYRQEQLLRDDKAARCIASWETRADIRTAIDRAATVPTEALIQVVTDADPHDVESFRAGTRAGIDDAVEALPDPECDLDAARERLGE